MTRSRPGRRTVTLGSLAAVGLAGCAEPAPPAPDTPATTAHEGAEPALAPSPAVPPAGTVAPAGYAAEGIVHDPATGLVAVGVRRPTRLLALDPRRLSVERSVPVPGPVRHLGLASGGGVVLVPNEGDDTLLTLDLRTGATTSTPVGHVPHDADGAANGDLLVADEFGGSLSIVRDGRVVRTVPGLGHPGGVVAVGDLAVVVDVLGYTLTSVDLTRLETVSRSPAGAGPTHAVPVGSDRLAVADTRGGRLLLFTAAPLRQVAEIELPGSPYGLACVPGESVVWVTLTATNEVVGVDVGADPPRVVERFPTVRQANSVAASADAVWVASRTDGVVQRIPR